MESQVDALAQDAKAALELKEKAARVAEMREAKKMAAVVYPFKPMGVKTPKGPYLGVCRCRLASLTLLYKWLLGSILTLVVCWCLRCSRCSC